MSITLTTGCNILASIALQTQTESILSQPESKISNAPTTSMFSQAVFKTLDSSTGSLLEISYIDVGQGDSILIQSPNGKKLKRLIMI